MQKEESIIHDLINEGYNEIPLAGESESERKRRVWKATLSHWWKKWKPTIIKSLKIIGKLVILGILFYFLFWVFIGAIILMAVGGGMSEAGKDAKARKALNDFYNQHRRY